MSTETNGMNGQEQTTAPAMQAAPTAPATTEPSGSTSPTAPAAPAELSKSDRQIAAMAKQINDLRSAVAAKEAAEAAAKATAEEAKLKAEGNYAELTKRAEDRVKALEATFAKKERDLQLAAAFAGVENEYTRLGMIAKCPEGTAPDDYAATLRKDHPELFQKLPFPKNDALPQGMRSSQDSQSLNWAQLKADHKSMDKDKVANAIDALASYKASHGGQYPPGWKD